MSIGAAPPTETQQHLNIGRLEEGMIIFKPLIFLVALGWVLIAAPSSAGPFEDGKKALDKENFPWALHLLKPLADRGSGEAQNLLGVMHSRGLGVEKNIIEGNNWFRKAAENGDPSAQTSLASHYRSGTGVPQSMTEALKWYGKAAEQGYADGQIGLGELYREGLGVPANGQLAVTWFTAAAQQGEVGQSAALSLAQMYEKGDGVAVDYLLAAQWYAVAARFNPTAQYSLGKMFYDYGKSSSLDIVDAHMWTNLSLGAFIDEDDYLMSDSASSLRKHIESKMTKSQLRESNKRLNDWRPAKRP